jgi:hypothetical protein
MIHHFNCPWVARHISFPLIFDWDDETGEVTGPGADLVMRMFKNGKVCAHPEPWSWDLTSTKSRTDIAAVIGSGWILPEELADDYPKQEEDDDPYFKDMDGNWIGKVVY